MKLECINCKKVFENVEWGDPDLLMHDSEHYPYTGWIERI